MIKAQRQALKKKKKNTNSSVVKPITQDQQSVENRLDTYFEARQEHWTESFSMEIEEETTFEGSEPRSAPPTATDANKAN